jgi:hypothetical protein
LYDVIYEPKKCTVFAERCRAAIRPMCHPADNKSHFFEVIKESEI